MHDIQKRALEYIRNAGGSPEIAWFDDDNEPIGPQLRSDLRKPGMIIEYEDGLTGARCIGLTDAGVEAIK